MGTNRTRGVRGTGTYSTIFKITSVAAHPCMGTTPDVMPHTHVPYLWIAARIFKRSSEFKFKL